MGDKLEARRLRYFMQVLESGSVRGAAGVLGMDASAVSRAVSLLERECGTPLFERRGRGITPTGAGQLLAAFLRRQQSERQNLLAQIDSIRKIESGHIDIMTGEGYVDWLMRKCLCGFIRSHPKITVSLGIGSTDEIVQAIVGQRVHLGVLFNPPKDNRLRSHYSLPHLIRTLVLRNHPLTQLKRPLKLADLTPYPSAALHSSFGLRQQVRAAEISEGVRLNVSFTATSFDAVGHFVLAGLGYALMSPLTIPATDTAKVVSLPMKSQLLNGGRSHVITLQGRTLQPAVVALLRKIVGAMKPPNPN